MALQRRKRKTIIHWIRIIFTTFVVLVIALFIALSKYDVNKLKPTIASALESASGLPVEINGKLSWQISLKPKIQIRDVRIKNADWAKHAYAVQVPKMLVEINLISILRNAPTIESLKFINPIVNIEENESGLLSIKSNKSKSALPDSNNLFPFDMNFGIGEIELEKPQIFFIKPDAIHTFAPDTFKINVVKKSETVDFIGNISDSDTDYPFIISFSKEQNKMYPVHIAVAGDVIPFSAEIMLDENKMPSSFNLKGNINKLKLLGDSLGVGLPEIANANVIFAGTVNNEKINIQKLSIKTKKSDFLFSGFYEFKKDKPTISLNIKSGVWDLDEFFTDLYGSGKYHWVRPARPLNAFMDTPLYGEVLSMFNADLTISIGELRTYRNMNIYNISGILNVKDGHGTVKTYSDYMGGNVLMKLDAENVGDSELSLVAATKARNISVGDIFASINERNYLAELPADMDFYMTAHGKDLAELMSSLTGPFIITSAGGGYAFEDMIDLIYGRDFLSTLREDAYGIFTGKKKNQLKINCAAVNLKVRNGKVEMEKNVAVETRAVNINFIGNVDLGREKMELSMNTTPIDGLRLSISGNIGNSMEFRGSLAEPELKFKKGVVAEKLATATGVGLAVGALTGGVGLLLGAGFGLVGTDVFNNWTADDSPCKTAFKEGFPKSKRGDPAFMNLPASQLTDEFIKS